MIVNYVTSEQLKTIEGSLESMDIDTWSAAEIRHGGREQKAMYRGTPLQVRGRKYRLEVFVEDDRVDHVIESLLRATFAKLQCEKTPVRIVVLDCLVLPTHDVFRGSYWNAVCHIGFCQMWHCDFSTLIVLTMTGNRLIFLHVATRRVILTPATLHPDKAWLTEQADSLVNQAKSQGL